MILTITGTQQGASPRQLARFADRIADLYNAITRIYHGGCIGFDEQAHAILYAFDLLDRVVVWPANVPGKRAILVRPPGPRPYKQMKARPPLERNRLMVDRSNRLIAVPYEREEQQRSGTWSTWRYAKKQINAVELILP